MSYLTIKSIAKQFGDVRVLKDVSIDISEGEFVALLGPSGCGKTTLLRIIAGLERPDGGHCALAGTDITDRPANKRGIGVVFQQFALFPHLTVFDNVAFGLRMRRISTAEQVGRVKDCLAGVRLSGFEARYPRQLSGGQQQRVALARALAIRPALLLLDEPFSSLDARLRREVRLELRALQKRLGITTVFVTHDQEEALALADRVIVMRNGSIEQAGKPEIVYRNPSTPFTATFVGEANLLPVTVTRVAGSMIDTRLSTGKTFTLCTETPAAIGESGLLVVRQEDVTIVDRSDGLPATIEVTAFMGSATLCVCRVEGMPASIRIRVEGNAEYQIGQQIFLEFSPTRALFLSSSKVELDELASHSAFDESISPLI